MTAPLSTRKLPTLDGKYALLRELGSGGAGTVYEAEHLVVGKRVAIKLLHAVADEGDARGRAAAEARAAARIAHANVVDIHDLGVTAEGVPYLVMELLQGETVAELVEQYGPQPARPACELALQMLAGLSAAHRNGIVHCDLKPANVMVTHPSPDQTLVKVLDFGIAKPIVETATESASIALGTPMYMAPEQVAGEPIDERTDVYASGVILYVLVTGRAPFSGKTARDVMRQVARGEFRPVLESNPDVPKALALIIENAMQRKRRDRVGSAEELAEKLRVFLASSAAASQSPKRPLVTGRPSRPSRGQSPDKSRPPESSVVRVDIALRTVTDSILMSPRLPKPPGSPKLEIGRDFMPMLGDPNRNRELERRQAPTKVPRSAPSALPAVLAMLVGFAAGVILAWSVGLI
jgi:serine/threonine protein kinase